MNAESSRLLGHVNVDATYGKANGKDFIPFAIAAAYSRIQDGYFKLLFQMQYRFIA